MEVSNHAEVATHADLQFILYLLPSQSCLAHYVSFNASQPRHLYDMYAT